MQESLPFPATDQPSTAPLPPTREAGLAALASFMPRAGRSYADNRNFDLPGHRAVSGLSAFIRYRAVTEAEVSKAVLHRYAPSTAEKFLQEVLWRTYFKGWLERRPSIWRDYQRGLDRARDRLATEAGLHAAWEDACEGRTGIAPFDHWAGELRATGYLHNHARMWFASIWMHTLRLPWELGADFFLRLLLDGDPASNTLSWRWVGGLHTRGKVYRARASNIAKFTDGRWDASTLGHQLAREDQVEPLAGPEHPAPLPAPCDAVFDRALRTGLVLHEDDLNSDFLRARGLKAEATAILIAPANRSPLNVSERVLAWSRALATDAANRQGSEVPVFEASDALVEWARTTGLEQLVLPYAPVGPTRDMIDAASAVLDIPVVRPLRAWDAETWPRCTAGFFRVKSQMGNTLATIPQDIGG